jgi:hypothetical protein
MYYKEDFGISFIASSIIICYGSIIYGLLSIVNIKVENILLVSMITSFCIILYDISYRFCDEMFYLHLKNHNLKRRL